MELLLLLLSLPLMMGAGLALDGLSSQAEGPDGGAVREAEEADPQEPDSDAAGDEPAAEARSEPREHAAQDGAGRVLPEEETLPDPWAMTDEHPADPVTLILNSAKSAPAEMDDYQPGEDMVVIEVDAFGVTQAATLRLKQAHEGVFGRLTDAATGLDDPVVLLRGAVLADVRPDDFRLSANRA